MNFTLLMSLYIKDDPDFFAEALESLVKCAYRPSECILVFDGPVTECHKTLVSHYQEQLNIRTLQLSSNVGLGRALNAGLQLCNTEWIARFDSDDICHPSRFLTQLEFIARNPDISIASGLIAEFTDNPEDAHAVRRVPLNHDEILVSAKKRNPFNHMAVMYKKSAVEKAGGYQDDYLFEDYALWVRMLANGERGGNSDEILVYARTGNGMAVRRGGWKYALSEAMIQYRFCSIGFISAFELVRNILLRIPVRLAPVWARKLAYNTVLRT